MENTVIQSLKADIYETILLHNDLLHCLKRERDALIRPDLDQLWQISREKEETCSNIESIRQKLVTAINQGSDKNAPIFHRLLATIPRESKVEFEKLCSTVVRLQSEIETFHNENKSLIDHSLRFLDEMISIITGEVQNKMLYNDKCQINKTSGNRLISREV